MSWVKGSHVFSDHSAIFYVTHKQVIMEKAVFGCLERVSDPDELEAACSELILRYRPGLAGFVLNAMNYNYNWQRWEFSVSHASLPSIKRWVELLMLPLDPALEKEVVSDQS